MTVLIFGGSLGAQKINRAVVDSWPRLSEHWENIQVIHVTGKRDYEEILGRYAPYDRLQKRVIDYCHEMPEALAAADLIICRSGASTVAELSVTRKPAILVPYPYASENHQLFNAEVLVKQAVAEVILDQEFSSDKLVQRLRIFLRHPERLSHMSARFSPDGISLHQHAAESLAKVIDQAMIRPSRDVL